MEEGFGRAILSVMPAYFRKTSRARADKGNELAPESLPLKAFPDRIAIGKGASDV
jgi:hypothetical protein